MKLLILTQKVNRNDPVLGFFHRWIEEFAKHFEKVTVICLEKGHYDLPTNVSVYSLGKEEGKGRLAYLFRFYSLVWKLRKDYDSVFVHMNPVYVILGGILWRAWEKKTGLWYTHKHVDQKLRVAHLLVDFVMSASKESFRLQSDKLHIMRHGIDTDFFAPRKEQVLSDRLSIITTGRISPVKDYETLIQAAGLLKKRIKDFSISIVGGVTQEKEKAYKESLDKLVEQLGLKSHITFVGPLPHDKLPPLLRAARVFVNMSHTGSLDKAILEAMSSGLIVVTSNEAFVPILKNFPTTLIFPPRNSEALANILFDLSQAKEDEVQEVARALRNIVVSDHGLANLITRIHSLYE